MLDDKYRIERLLATGGMGAVYLGTHVGLRKRVAIKVLNPQFSNGPMLERFHREAITASQIGHEGIAQVTDLGTSAEGEPFLVMEYLEGESLASRIKTSGPLGVEDACEIGCAILAPLAAAHAAGIVHRDLKPDNVFLVRQSRGEMVKLLDFGISRTTSRESSFRLTTTGLVLGTPYYMSPEQARGDSEITFAADLYAFGVMLYEMLVGDVPMRADNYNQLMYRVMIGDFLPPRRRRPDLPEAVERIIVHAMAIAPHDRPQSATELEQALLPLCRPVFREHPSAPGLLLGTGARRAELALLSGPGSSGSSPAIIPAGPPGPPGLGAHVVPGGPDLDALESAVTDPHLPEPSARGSSLDVVPTTAAVAIGGAVPESSRLARVLIGCAVLAGTIVLVGSLAIALSGRDREPAPAQPAPSVALVETRPAEPPPAPEAPPPAPAEAVHDGSAASAPAAVPEASQEPPAARATITLRFAVEPPGATILVDGKPVSGTELVVPRDAALHQLRITAAGYVGRDDKIAFDESQRLVVQLRRAFVPARGKRKDRAVERIDSQSPYD